MKLFYSNVKAAIDAAALLPGAPDTWPDRASFISALKTLNVPSPEDQWTKNDTGHWILRVDIEGPSMHTSNLAIAKNNGAFEIAWIWITDEIGSIGELESQAA